MEEVSVDMPPATEGLRESAWIQPMTLAHEPPVFPPRETQDWLRCPVYRDLSKKWEPRGPWEPNRALGTAIAKGLEVYFKNPGADGPAWTACEQSLESEYVEQPAWTLEGLKKLAARGLKLALEQAATIVATEHILLVEEPVGECRPDLVTRSKADGQLIVTDGKVSLNLDPRWQDKRLGEYDSDFQFWHYAWRVGEHFGEPVAWTRLQLTVLSPKTRSLLVPYRVTSKRVSFWLQGAQQAWEGMERERQGAPPAPNFMSCHGRYGRCPMYDACHVLDRDPKAMKALYTQRGSV